MSSSAPSTSSSLQHQQQQPPQQDQRISQPRIAGGGVPASTGFGGQQQQANGGMRRASGSQQPNISPPHKFSAPFTNMGEVEIHRRLCAGFLDFANKPIQLNPDQPPMDGDSVDKTFANGQKISAIYLLDRFWIPLQGVDLTLVAALFLATGLSINATDFLGPLKRCAEEAVPPKSTAHWCKQASNAEEWAGLVSRGAVPRDATEVTLYVWGSVNYEELYRQMFGPTGPFPLPPRKHPAVPSGVQNPPSAPRRDSGGIPLSKVNSNGSMSNGGSTSPVAALHRRPPLKSNGSGSRAPEFSPVAAMASYGYTRTPERKTCLACVTHGTVCDLLVICSQCVERYATAIQNLALSLTGEPPSGFGCEYPPPEMIDLTSSSPPPVHRPTLTLNGDGARSTSNPRPTSRPSSASTSPIVPFHPPTAVVPSHQPIDPALTSGVRRPPNPNPNSLSLAHQPNLPVQPQSVRSPVGGPSSASPGSSTGNGAQWSQQWTSQEPARQDRVAYPPRFIPEPNTTFTRSLSSNLPPTVSARDRNAAAVALRQQQQQMPPPPARTPAEQGFLDQVAAEKHLANRQKAQQAQELLRQQQHEQQQQHPPRAGRLVHPCCGGFAHQPSCPKNPERLMELKQRAEEELRRREGMGILEQQQQQQRGAMAQGGGGGGFGVMNGSGMGAPQTPAPIFLTEEEGERNTLEFEFEEWVRHCGKETGYIFTSNVQDKPRNPDDESTMIPLASAPSRVLEILLGSKCPEMATEEPIKSKLDPLLEREKETNEEPGWTV